MVLTITLSPRVERKIVLSGFCIGEENQIIDAKETVSGRGIRAGMALKELGDKVLCMGFALRKASASLNRRWPAKRFSAILSKFLGRCACALHYMIEKKAK